MKKIFFILILLGASLFFYNYSWTIKNFFNILDNKNPIYVWYYPSWNKYYWYDYSKIKVSDYDIINIAFIFPNSDWTLEIPKDTILPELNKKIKNEKRKVIVSIWGWNNSENFKLITNNENTKNKFIKEIEKFIWENNYDWVDIDWEWIKTQEEGEKYINFLADLKNELKWKIVTTAISINYDYFDIKKLSNIVDYIYIMSYDIEWWRSGYAWYNAPLYENSRMPYDLSINYFIKEKFLKKDIEKSKFIFWLPLYWRKFNVINPYDKTQTVSEYIRYWDLPNNCKNVWDDESKVPYLKCDSYYISYDNMISLKEKINYVKNNWFWGVFIRWIWEDNWSISSEIGNYLNQIN